VLEQKTASVHKPMGVWYSEAASAAHHKACRT